MKPDPDHQNAAGALSRSIDSRPSSTVATCIRGRRILVTGAGGSIGSALVQAIASSSPASLILLDASEHALYQIDRTLNEASAPVRHSAILGSICDSALLADIFRLEQPQIVFHAAAFKHVPLLEQNPFAAIENNVLGSCALLQAAMEHQAEQLILVSTDKAVDPLSLMGASKRIAELLLLAEAASPTRLSAVRLGNVMGTQGSVVPLFLDQIAHGGPLTVTHPEARRFFLTLDQGVEAIISALEPRPEAEQNATILIPDLGAPVRIADLAHSLIEAHSSGASIVFTKLRPGDKLEESLLSSQESRLIPSGDRTRTLTAITSPALSSAVLHAAMRRLQQAVAARDLASLLRTVLQLVPEYAPSSILLDALETLTESPQELRA